MKLLFITRNSGSKPIISLSDASNYAYNYLKSLNIDVEMVSINDYSVIEEIMDTHKPSHVIIESIFIPPINFLRYLNLYRGVKWYIRIHSDVGFFFTETFGISWIKDYQSISSDIVIAVNNKRFVNILNYVLDKDVVYLPNLYKLGELSYKEKELDAEYIDIGCFGALRQMKNHGYQAMAAIMYAKSMNKNCRFHINIAKSEYKKNSVISNLRHTFKGTNHKLIEHPWMNHKDFNNLVQNMDFGTQLSFSESFNYVVADFLSLGVPIAVSDTIDWVNDNIKTSTFEVEKTLELYKKLYTNRNNIDFLNDQYDYLKLFLDGSKHEWINFLKNI